MLKTEKKIDKLHQPVRALSPTIPKCMPHMSCMKSQLHGIENKDEKKKTAEPVSKFSAFNHE